MSVTSGQGPIETMDAGTQSKEARPWTHRDRPPRIESPGDRSQVGRAGIVARPSEHRSRASADRSPSPSRRHSLSHAPPMPSSGALPSPAAPTPRGLRKSRIQHPHPNGGKARSPVSFRSTRYGRRSLMQGEPSAPTAAAPPACPWCTLRSPVKRTSTRRAWQGSAKPKGTP